MSISTVRAIIKEVLNNVSCNKPAWKRTQVYFTHSQLEGRLELQKFLQGSRLEICRRWHHFGITKALNLQLDTTSMPTLLEGKPEEIQTQVPEICYMLHEICLEPGSMIT